MFLVSHLPTPLSTCIPCSLLPYPLFHSFHNPLCCLHDFTFLLVPTGLHHPTAAMASDLPLRFSPFLCTSLAEWLYQDLWKTRQQLIEGSRYRILTTGRVHYHPASQ